MATDNIQIVNIDKYYDRYCLVKYKQGSNANKLKVNVYDKGLVANLEIGSNYNYRLIGKRSDDYYILKNAKSVSGNTIEFEINEYITCLDGKHETNVAIYDTEGNQTYIFNNIIFIYIERNSLVSSNILTEDNQSALNSIMQNLKNVTTLDDSNISAEKSYSSYKINELINSKTEIDDSNVSTDKVYSSKKVNDLVNDTNTKIDNLTLGEENVQANWNESDSTKDSFILNKPTLFSGSYTDLTNKPTIPSEYTLPTASTSTLGGVKVDGSSITIADGIISSVGEENVQVDWNVTDTASDAYIKNKPTIPSEYTLPTATTTTLGGVKVDGTTITIEDGVISSVGGTDGDSDYELPIASTTELGGVKIDGTTITIQDGVISSVGGTGGGGVGESTTGEVIPVFTNSGELINSTCGEGAEIFNCYKDITDSSGDISISKNVATGIMSHAEGKSTLAYSDYSHTEGLYTCTYGECSHSEGYYSNCTGKYAHAEGKSTSSNGESAHAEGANTIADGKRSHAEGDNSQAYGEIAHAEGLSSQAYGMASHAEGCSTVAYGEYQHVSGRYNAFDENNKYAVIVGNGTESKKTNALTLDWDGNIKLPMADSGLILTNTDGTECKVTASLINSFGTSSGDGSGDSDYTLPIASTTELGGVKVDGTTITITDGVISSVGGTSSGDGVGEQNVQSDWNMTDSTSDAYIKNKPTLFSGSYEDLSNKPTIPSDYELPTASNNTLGGVKVDGTTIIIEDGVISSVGGTSETGDYELPIASTTALGGVKVDGTTITIADGVISSVGGTSSGGGVGEDTTGDVVTINEVSVTCGEGAEIFNLYNNNSITLNGYTYHKNIASGICTHAEGLETIASGIASHVEGWDSIASGESSHAEGYSQATGSCSHSEGYQTVSSSSESHAEGNKTTASGVASHAEGESTVASGTDSHAEGYYTKAIGTKSHAEGDSSQATGTCSHAEGYATQANGNYSHVSGKLNTPDTSNKYAVIVGNGSMENFSFSNAYMLDWDGNITLPMKDSGLILTNTDGTQSKVTASLINSLSSGSGGGGGEENVQSDWNVTDTASDAYIKNKPTIPSAYSLPTASTTTLGGVKVDGTTITIEDGVISSVGGTGGDSDYELPMASTTELGGVKVDGTTITIADGVISSVGGTSSGGGVGESTTGDTVTITDLSENSQSVTCATGAEIFNSYNDINLDDYTYHKNIASGMFSHAEGIETVASGKGSHSEGWATMATAECSHAEGYTVASGKYSHSEGAYTMATKYTAHSEGYYTTASGENSHTEGSGTKASGYDTHAEGYGSQAIGDESHAEGFNTQANGYASHAEGFYTVANGNYQHVSGKYNASDDSNRYAMIVGNGTESTKTNAFTLDWDGNIKLPTYNSGLILTNEDGTDCKITSSLINSLTGGGTASSVGENTNGNTVVIDNKYVTCGIGAEIFNCYADDSTNSTVKNIASGIYSHVEGASNIASGNISHAEGNQTQSVGNDSHAEGYKTGSGGFASHAEGNNARSNGNASHAEGLGTYSIGGCSHAEGNYTTANGENSHTEGDHTITYGAKSHAEGFATIANGIASHAEGVSTTALDFQHAQGHYNNTITATIGVTSGTSSGTAFVIGNGIDGTPSNAFRVTYDGNVYATGTTINTGADYAEYFEWEDGNIDNEDRIGYFVTLNGKKVKKVSSQDDYILGVVSRTACIIGNGDEDWQGKFIHDEFGRVIYETYEEEYEETKHELNDNTNELDEIKETKTRQVTFPKVNPEYDNSKPYKQRSERQEWDAIGMLGIVYVRDDGTCEVNGFCTCNEQGIATSTTYSRNINCYRIVERIDENVIQIIFK